MFDACKRRVVGELDAADGQVVASEHRGPVAVVLDLHLVIGEVEQLQQVVVVKEDAASVRFVPSAQSLKKTFVRQPMKFF